MNRQIRVVLFGCGSNNDYLLELSDGIRKGFYILDIPEIDDWLANPEFEHYFLNLWPSMSGNTRRQLESLRRHDDEKDGP